jgi:ubiquinone/menaquinone biosynthesis C-methylase UbiE
MEHARRIERAFTTQADAFEDPSRNQVFTSDARWVFERLPLTADDVVLDVAAGTGHAARQLAATGFRPRAGNDGDVWFTQTFGSAIAVKPA